MPRGVQKVRDLYSRYRRWILKGKKEAGPSAFVGREREDILAVEGDAALNVILRMAGEREGERRFAASVGAHKRGDAPGFDGQIDAFEDLFAGDAAAKISDAQNRGGACDLS